MFDEPKLLPLGQMARHVRVPVAWLRKQAEQGAVPCLRAGNKFLFDPEAVETVLIERARGDRKSEVIEAWTLVLESARQTENPETEARAIDALAQYGVTVDEPRAVIAPRNRGILA